MSAERAFVDTNIVIYAFSSGDDYRHARAAALLRELHASGRLCVSTQVVQETFAVATRKAVTKTPQQALAIVDWLGTCPVTPCDFTMVRQAAVLSATAGLSIWDALVVVAAATAGSTVLYTEDLQHGQEILGVRISNPFVEGSVN